MSDRMMIEEHDHGLLRASMKNNGHSFVWYFTANTLQECLRDVVNTAAAGDIDYSDAATMTKGMRHAVQEFKHRESDIAFDPMLARLGCL